MSVDVPFDEVVFMKTINFQAEDFVLSSNTKSPRGRGALYS